jgi:hypothetical protein
MDQNDSNGLFRFWEKKEVTFSQDHLFQSGGSRGREN